MKKLIEFIILLIGISIIIRSIYYFYFIRNEIPLTLWFIISTCVFLIAITYNPKIITGMKINILNKNNARHYHSMVVSMIIGYSAVVGIGIALIWSEQGGLIWRDNVAFLLVILTIYYNFVLYTIFYRNLRKQIANNN